MSKVRNCEAESRLGQPMTILKSRRCRTGEGDGELGVTGFNEYNGVSEGQSRINMAESQVKVAILACELCRNRMNFNPTAPGNLCSQRCDQKDAEE